MGFQDIHDFSVMLMVMMVTFFTPTPTIQQPQKVTRAHDYYMHKLQVFIISAWLFPNQLVF